MARLKFLSIGLQLEGDAFDNADFGNAPSISEYDAVVVNISALSVWVSEIRAGMRHGDINSVVIQNTGEQHVAGRVTLAELIARRNSEAELLLLNGGLLVCFTYSPVRHEIQGIGNWWTYDWLPPRH